LRQATQPEQPDQNRSGRQRAHLFVQFGTHHHDGTDQPGNGQDKILLEYVRPDIRAHHQCGQRIQAFGLPQNRRTGNDMRHDLGNRGTDRQDRKADKTAGEPVAMRQCNGIPHNHFAQSQHQHDTGQNRQYISGHTVR